MHDAAHAAAAAGHGHARDVHDEREDDAGAALSYDDCADDTHGAGADYVHDADGDDHDRHGDSSVHVHVHHGVHDRVPHHCDRLHRRLLRDAEWVHDCGMHNYLQRLLLVKHCDWT